jgi:hypothetical protein
MTCKYCGCEDHDCRNCVEKTGAPCFWYDENVCSTCAFERGLMKPEEIAYYARYLEEESYDDPEENEFYKSVIKAAGAKAALF